MKRSEFLKRLGLGLGAAVAAPSLLKEKDEWTYEIEEPEIALDESINKSELVFSVTDIEGDSVDLKSANISMQIKNDFNDIYLKKGEGLTVNGNTINLDCYLSHGEHDYEMIIDNVLASKGKIRI